jgi:hypothetical protein
MENPFDSPTTIRDPKKLVGRDEHLKRIFGLLKNQQNVSVVGAKRIGKTSLLTILKDEETQRRFGFPGKDFLFLSIDLQERSLKKNENFFDDINPLIRQQGHKYLQGVLLEEFEDDEFVNLLSAIKQQGLHPVLMIDTFDLITRYKQADIDFFGFLRSQGSIGQVSYVTASIKTVGKICPSDTENLGSPFFNIFRNVQLGPLNEKESRDLLSNFSAAEGLPFTDKEVSWVLEIAGCHPYFIQQVGAALFQEKSTGNAEKINFQRIKKEVYQDLEDYFIDYWNLLDQDERKQLAEETLHKERKENKYPELNSSELFYEYLDRIYKPEETPVTEIDIESFEKILNKLNDARGLGESVLARHPAISARIPAEKAKESITRGIVVREILKEAFERLQAQGTRQDTAPEWRIYNILYYRYFGGWDITHKQIAARLALSERQYYRELKNAIITHWKMLLEMIVQEDPSLVAAQEKKQSVPGVSSRKAQEK